MGIRYFYPWIKRHFHTQCIQTHLPQDIDTLAIDMNGLFHESLEKIHSSTTNTSFSHVLTSKNNVILFKQICERLEDIKNHIKPRKKLILCVDGIAGMGKVHQQRQRRYQNKFINGVASSQRDTGFDINNFTPGTKLMDFLTKYIDWYIRNMMTYHPDWQSLEVVFSNEKVQGEGEHKLIQYIRKYTLPTERVCIVGNDADLLLLGLLSRHSMIWVARIYRQPQPIYEYVDIHRLKDALLDHLRWEQPLLTVDEPVFHIQNTLYDFVTITFLMGNDFLPAIPCLCFQNGTFDKVLSLYRQNAIEHGNLLYKTTTDNISFHPKAWVGFFEKLSQSEAEFYETLYNSQTSFYPDPSVLKNMTSDTERFHFNFQAYRIEYYQKRQVESVEEMISSYLRGIAWTINYYEQGIPDWTWFYPYYYTPLFYDLHSYVLNHQRGLCTIRFQLNDIVTPFLQLLFILPHHSRSLLPVPLSSLLDHSSVLGKYYPSSVHMDVTGKTKECDGILQLPIIRFQDFKMQYDLHIGQVSPTELKRNIKGKHFQYRTDISKPYIFHSFYGSIPDCPIYMIIS